MRPVRARMCAYESLIDPASPLSLCDIARMNECLDVEEENRARAQAATERK